MIHTYPPRPACFPTHESWTGWIDAAREIPSREDDVKAYSLNVDYCKDCTPSYQKEQRECGNCRHPYTSFSVNKDGLVEGIRR
jgi:hypothetical protein